MRRLQAAHSRARRIADRVAYILYKTPGGPELPGGPAAVCAFCTKCTEGSLASRPRPPARRKDPDRRGAGAARPPAPILLRLPWRRGRVGRDPTTSAGARAAPLCPAARQPRRAPPAPAARSAAERPQPAAPGAVASPRAASTRTRQSASSNAPARPAAGRPCLPQALAASERVHASAEGKSRLRPSSSARAENQRGLAGLWIRRERLEAAHGLDVADPSQRQGRSRPHGAVAQPEERSNVRAELAFKAPRPGSSLRRPAAPTSAAQGAEAGN